MGDARGEAYSFLAKKNLISFKRGVEEGYDKLPPAIEKKLKNGKALTANEEQLKAALQDLAKDRILPQRTGFNGCFNSKRIIFMLMNTLMMILSIMIKL